MDKDIIPFSERHRKGIRLAFWIVLIVGSAAVGWFSAANGLEKKTRTVILVCWLAAVLTSSVAIDLIWSRQLSRAINSLTPMLYTDPDGYIRGVRALLDGKRSSMAKNVRAINLSAALYQKGMYAEAEETILEADEKRLSPPMRPVYWADLALYRFRLGRYDDALEIMNAQRPAIDAARPALGATAACLDVLEARARGDLPRARELLSAARAAFPEPKHLKEWRSLEDILK